mgnify:CR=1 FL=1
MTFVRKDRPGGGHRGLGREIDVQVYKLYRLTQEEIAAVEGTARTTGCENEREEAG